MPVAFASGEALRAPRRISPEHNILLMFILYLQFVKVSRARST